MIITPKYYNVLDKRIKANCQLRGEVSIKIYSPEDIMRAEPVYTDRVQNTIDGDLMAWIVDHIDASTSGSTSYHLHTSTNWFNDGHGEYDAGTHDQNGKNGIILDANASVAYGGTTHAFFVGGDSKSSSVSTNTATWEGTSTWDGVNRSGSGDSGTCTSLIMGKSWSAPTSSSTSIGSFSTAYASASVSSFTMSVGDEVTITWNITVG